MDEDQANKKHHARRAGRKFDKKRDKRLKKLGIEEKSTKEVPSIVARERNPKAFLRTSSPFAAVHKERHNLEQDEKRLHLLLLIVPTLRKKPLPLSLLLWVPLRKQGSGV
eukprot:TRINITY_DN576_c0_g1_i2.p1 TRINITY_DN576_c0_g1~~TRINITY_DN576_c0_g1_i2.p1  ORF type:complete len:110 (-),score=19.72 TRINITY_DN576_c0_g1_i2:283-612(-)